jgi:hypothetical protein
LRAKADKAEAGGQAASPAAAPPKTFSNKKKSSEAVALRRVTITSPRPLPLPLTFFVVSQVPGQIRAGSYQTDKEKFEIDVIKTLLSSYFDIVRKRLRDLVPKSVMLFVVQVCVCWCACAVVCFD